MAKIGLIRIDDRLIHGQVVTTWINHTASTRILIADNELANNKFMASIYTMAAPKGLTVEVIAIDHLAQEWKKDELGTGTLLILFKNVKALYDAYQKGFHFSHVQIAGLASGPGKKLVYKSVGLDKESAMLLKDLHDQGVNVEFQSMPGEKIVDIQTIIKKYFTL
ncbi:PTS sugar transporter subunit IIB [[Eubacterium] hominis]|uniref:PTS sugar transporter subunit IIB n=1 Tax=[Eubacterium] hominis TaxID=2764325 RepID=UPI003A4E5EAC